MNPFKPKHKFKATITECDGIKFHSKKEAEYYKQLLLKQKAGIVIGFLRQVPIHLPGNVKLIVDFLEFHADGNAYLVDTKGYRTPQYIDKKKIAESVYPWLKIIEK